jgi:hypothetical protein
MLCDVGYCLLWHYVCFHDYVTLFVVLALVISVLFLFIVMLCYLC